MNSGAARQEFEAFVNEAAPHLYRLGLLLTGNVHDAEDATQECLVRVAKRWSSVRQNDALAYARRVLTNSVTDGYRRAAVRTRKTSQLESRIVDDSAHDRSADRLDIIKALRRLPPRQRATIVLRYWGGLSEPEVAATLGCSTGTVKSQTHRAMETLRQQLEIRTGR